VQIALGERADLVADFTPHRGAQFLLMSDAITLMRFRIAVGAGVWREQASGATAGRVADGRSR
jgi:hypothetical protein